MENVESVNGEKIDVDVGETKEQAKVVKIDDSTSSETNKRTRGNRGGWRVQMKRLREARQVMSLQKSAVNEGNNFQATQVEDKSKINTTENKACDQGQIRKRGNRAGWRVQNQRLRKQRQENLKKSVINQPNTVQVRKLEDNRAKTDPNATVGVDQGQKRKRGNRAGWRVQKRRRNNPQN